VRIQRQLSLDDEQPNEDDTRSAVGGKSTGQIERMLRLLPVEEWHDDAAIGDGLRPQHKAARAAPESADVRKPPHRVPSAR
jgi:hypothetical protein